jgi:hypothetical protein
MRTLPKHSALSTPLRAQNFTLKKEHLLFLDSKILIEDRKSILKASESLHPIPVMNLTSLWVDIKLPEWWRKLCPLYWTIHPLEWPYSKSIPPLWPGTLTVLLQTQNAVSELPVAKQITFKKFKLKNSQIAAPNMWWLWYRAFLRTSFIFMLTTYVTLHLCWVRHSKYVFWSHSSPILGLISQEVRKIDLYWLLAHRCS